VLYLNHLRSKSTVNGKIWYSRSILFFALLVLLCRLLRVVLLEAACRSTDAGDRRDTDLVLSSGVTTAGIGGIRYYM